MFVFNFILTVFHFLLLDLEAMKRTWEETWRRGPLVRLVLSDQYPYLQETEKLRDLNSSPAVLA